MFSALLESSNELVAAVKKVLKPKLSRTGDI